MVFYKWEIGELGPAVGPENEPFHAQSEQDQFRQLPKEADQASNFEAAEGAHHHSLLWQQLRKQRLHAHAADHQTRLHAQPQRRESGSKSLTVNQLGIGVMNFVSASF